MILASFALALQALLVFRLAKVEESISELVELVWLLFEAFLVAMPSIEQGSVSIQELAFSLVLMLF